MYYGLLYIKGDYCKQQGGQCDKTMVGTDEIICANEIVTRDFFYSTSNNVFVSKKQLSLPSL